MSFWRHVKHTFHKTTHIGNRLHKFINHADAELRKHNAPNTYVGYNSNDGVEVKPFVPNTNVQLPNERQIYDDEFQAAMTQTPTYTTPIGNMTKAYQGNAAKTATSIKQGGMTKDELIDFNNRHPNETVNRG